MEQNTTSHAENANFATNLYRLGLEDMYAKVYSAERFDPQEDLKNKNVYVLLHGWTGNHTIYTDVKQASQLSVVEEIMAKDPNAVVIAMDGNGFGQSPFRQDVLKGNIQEYCTPEAYAEQVNFFVKDVLDLEDANIMGHSMGGAAALVLSGKYGYENVVALSPAFFPTKENIAEVETSFEDTQEASKIENLLAKLGYTSLGDARYAFIANVARFGAKAKRVIPKTTDIATQVFFKAIGPGCIGEQITGDPDFDKQVVDTLKGIHSSELNHHEVVDNGLKTLRTGIDFSKWSYEELYNMLTSAVLVSKMDTLVTPRDVQTLLQTVSAYMLLRATDSNIDEEQLQALRAENMLTSDRNAPAEDHIFVLDGGHYATLYNELGVDTLVEGAKKYRKIHSRT